MIWVYSACLLSSNIFSRRELVIYYSISEPYCRTLLRACWHTFILLWYCREQRKIHCFERDSNSYLGFLDCRSTHWTIESTRIGCLSWKTRMQCFNSISKSSSEIWKTTFTLSYYCDTAENNEQFVVSCEIQTRIFVFLGRRSSHWTMELTRNGSVVVSLFSERNIVATT